MTEDDKGGTWHFPVLVAFCGGVGGLAAWVWSITVGTPLELETAGAIAANVFLGVVAGFVGIYAIKLGASQMLMHSLALAMLCGFAWKPMLEAGRELVTTLIEEQEIEEQVAVARQSIEALEGASPEKAAIYIEKLGSVSRDLMRSGDAVRNARLRAEVDEVVVDSIEALGEAATKAPEAGARALGSVGAAALGVDRPGLSQAVVGSLVRLAEKTGFEVAASSEVSNSLMRLSAAARAGLREDVAGALREQSQEVFRQAERRVRRSDPGRIRELRERSLVTRELPPPQR